MTRRAVLVPLFVFSVEFCQFIIVCLLLAVVAVVIFVEGGIGGGGGGGGHVCVCVCVGGGHVCQEQAGDESPAACIARAPVTTTHDNSQRAQHCANAAMTQIQTLIFMNFDSSNWENSKQQPM